ncbi:MAG: hypothetical protein ACN6OP_19625 [Pseudomonadales bacterium]
MKVIKAPPIQFTCKHCDAVNEGEEHEFRELNTVPPTWLAFCGYCDLDNQVSPSPLVARAVGTGRS